MGKLTLEDVEITDNKGNGLEVVGDAIVEGKGLIIARNGGSGVINREASLVEKLGLPAQTDPKELAQLITLLLTLPAEQRPAAVQNSGLFAKLKSLVVDGSTLANNIAGLASNPNVVQWIQMLSA